MSFLVLSRKPILDQLASWLGPAAADTVVITSATGPDQRGAFRHVERLADYGGSGAGATIVEVAQRFGVRRIGSLNEVDVLRAAAIRHALELPGQSQASAVAYRDKLVMKSIAGAAGIPVARMRLLAQAAAGPTAVDGLRYPLVVKPVAGGGSVGVQFLTGPADWASVRTPGPLLAEEQVAETDFYIVDGLMRAGAATQHVVLRMGMGNVVYTSNGQPVAGYSLPVGSVLAVEVSDLARQVLAALPPTPDETAFHMEVFRDRTGRLLLCEVASRAGGMGHAPTFEAVTGIDLNRASLLGQLGLSETGPPVNRVGEAAFAGLPKRGGRLARQPDRLKHPAIVHYTTLVSCGDQVPASRWVGDDAAQFRMAAPVGTDLAGPLADALAEYWAGTEWLPAAELTDELRG